MAFSGKGGGLQLPTDVAYSAMAEIGIDLRRAPLGNPTAPQMMDIRQVTYFLRVYEERSFTKAARKANVVQSALSMQIHRLEDALKARLFERTPNGVEPTLLGRRFYDLFAPVAQDMTVAQQRILEIVNAGDLAGAIRCGLPPTFFKAIIGKVIPKYAERHPYVRITIVESYGGTLTNWVRAGELDFALGAWLQNEPGLTYDQVYEEQLALVSGRPIAGPNFTYCDLGEIEDLKLFVPTPRQVLGPVLRDCIARGQIRPSQTIEMDSYLGVLEAARASNWGALIPVCGLLDEIGASNLFIYPIRRPRLTFDWHLVRPKRRPLSHAARLFVDMVAAELTQAAEEWTKMTRDMHAPSRGPGRTTKSQRSASPDQKKKRLPLRLDRTRAP